MKIVIPYSLAEIFNPNARQRAASMRAEVVEIFGKEQMPEFVCGTNRHLGGHTPLALSTKSEQDHQKVMTYLRQIKYGVYI